MEQGVVMSGNWLALSGWAACVITIVLQVAYYNRFFGRIEANLETVMKAAEKAHSRIDDIEKHPPLSRPCKELIDLQRDISDRLARIETKLEDKLR